ncbi:MAG: hypothetical protein L3K26_01550 [Candidatus Hydrogenedentes bacterium]|nr:hypothetical protein [Candidatus Hydrogenedentota bacterium]
MSRKILRGYRYYFLALACAALSLLVAGRITSPPAHANSGGTGTYYILTLCSPPGGSITQSPAGTSFVADTEVTLTATPSSGWKFKNWTVDASGSTNPLTVTMSTHKSICAEFEQIKLTVNKLGNGQVSVDPPPETLTPNFTKTYNEDTNVALVALPATGWAFKEWTGDKTGTSASTNILVNGTKSVVAIFEKIELTVAKEGEGSVHIDPPDITPTTLPHTEEYLIGDVVTLTATPVAGWAFKEWTGDLTTTTATDTITMDKAKSVTAVFIQVELTVNKTGEGDVTASPGGGMQTPTFSEKYAPGTSVTITAHPAPGWGFKEWTGALISTSASDTIVVDEDASVTAVFEQVTLSVSKTGEGQVTATPPGGLQTPPFSEKYARGTSVTLTATPATGWGFKEWTGDLVSTLASDTIVVDVDKSVTAVFVQATLSVSKTGEGQVTATPPGGPQTPPFSEQYAPGTSVTLTAVPATGWGFKEWTGDLNSTSASDTIVVDVDKSVTAVFEQKSLTVTKTGEGQVTTSPYGSTNTPTFTKDYAPGTSVTLTAVPAAGWFFKEWFGDVAGTLSGTTVIMDANKSAHAHFEQIKLTVTKSGEGQVSATPGGGTQTPTFTEFYTVPTTVQLSALPATGWQFKEWTGDIGGTNSATSTFVDRAKTVTAVFEEAELDIVSVDASSPFAAKMTCVVSGTFDSVVCTVPTGTQTLSNVSDNFDIVFSQDDLPTGSFTFDVKGYVNATLVSSDSCIATKPEFSTTPYADEFTPFIHLSTLEIHGYTHYLNEEYYLISYGVPYGGNTAVVRKAIAALFVGSDYDKIAYVDEHRYEDGASVPITSCLIMTQETGMGVANTFYNSSTVGAFGEGRYIDPNQLTGVAAIYTVLHTTAAGTTTMVTSNPRTERTIP